MALRKLIAILLLVMSALTGQEKRPKIGLALEGGGALGLAHVGVLEWLEENHIPIDYVAGTSMGGLVGGMYAMGKTPAEIRELVKHIDWEDVMRGETSYRNMIFRRKEDLNTYQNPLELGLKGGLSLPGGLNSGHKIGMILNEATLPYSELKSFDDLPIPYRCVATELSANKLEVFKDGSLSAAMRATMSIPGFFAPLKYNGKVYADGGLLENLPVDVVKEMGADIVIAIHLQVKPYDSKDIGSPIATLSRSISVVIAVNELRSMAKADILVSVPLEDFSSSSYTDSEDLIEKGREAATGKSAILRKLAVSPDSYRQYRAAVDARRLREIAIPQFVEVDGPNKQLADQVAAEMLTNVGTKMDFETLDRNITSVLGIGRFSKIDYSMVEKDGKSGLLIHAEEKTYLPPTLKPGLFIDGSDFNNVQFSVGGRVTMLDLGGYRRELRMDAQVGSIYSFRSEYYRPFNPTGTWFLAPYGFASDAPISIYSDGSRFAEYRTREAGGGIDIGTTPNRFSEFRAGYRLNQVWLTRKIGDPDLPSLSGTAGVTSARYVIDKLDSAIVPRSGTFLRTRMEWWDKNLGSSGGFPLAEATSSYFRPVSRPASIYVTGAAGTTFGNEDVGLPVFTMGGVRRLSAYGQNEFMTNQYLYGKVGYLHQLGRLPVFAGNRIFGQIAYEVGKPYGVQSTRVPNNGSLGVVMETFIGPIFIGGSLGDSGHRKIYFQIGRFF